MGHDSESKHMTRKKYLRTPWSQVGNRRNTRLKNMKHVFDFLVLDDL